MKKILVIGSGGREHAIAWKLAQSIKVGNVFVAPGNKGMIGGKIQIVEIPGTHFSKLIEFAKLNDIDYTVVGPETELSLGIVDEFEKHNLKIFGPNMYCSQLESSKVFCKIKMQEFSIPTAKYNEFIDIYKARQYLKNHTKFPLVIKLDGLAQGKGVVIATNLEQAQQALINMLEKNIFGMKEPRIIIEEFLDGVEFSQLAFVNNNHIAFLQIAQDYKKAYDNDKGPNTGGMGAYTPVDFLSEKQILEGQIIIKKLVEGMKKQGHPFKGVIYAGLIATKERVNVIEFNVRFGDPEAEVILKALKSDLYEVINDLLNEKQITLKWSSQTYVGVVLASKGYPGPYSTSYKLKKIKPRNNNIFYMGVDIVNDELISKGGRVLICIGEGLNKSKAHENAYKIIKNQESLDFFYRKDIGL